MKLTLPIKKLNNNNKVKTNISIGLDIGYRYLKLISLGQVAGGVVLDDFALKALPFGQLHQYGEEIPRFLKEFFNSKYDHVTINISLAGKSVIVRDVWVPQMSMKELATSIQYELDQYIPFSVEDVYYDSYILEESEITRREGQMRVVLAVAKKKMIEERLQWLRKAGLQAAVVSVDAIVLANAFGRLAAAGEEKTTIAVVDIGAHKTIINVLAEGLLVFTREVEYGTIKVTEGIVRGLSVSQEEAEKLITVGDEKIKGWVQDLLARLSKELWGSFEYYEGQEHRFIDKTYLCGGGSLFPGFAASLSQAIGLPVEIWNPLADTKMELEPARLAELQRIAPLMGIAFGLAYR